LLDEEVDLNDIIIKDEFNGGIEAKFYETYNEPLIDTNNIEKYFEVVVDDFEFKKKKMASIGIEIGKEYFPDDLQNLPITDQYFSKKVSNNLCFDLVQKLA